MRDLILVGIVIVCALIAVRRPVFGILTFVCFGIVNPQGMTWDFGRVFPLAMYTALGTIIGFALWSEPKRIPKQREVVMLLALWGTFAISTLFAIYPNEAQERLTHISKILLMTFLCMAILNNEARLHLLLKVLALSLGFIGLKSGTFVIASGGGQMVYGPEESFLASNNSIGLALAMNVPLLVYVLKREQNRHVKWLVRTMIAMSYPAVVCTFSRGAWIGLAAATAMLVLKGRHKFMMVAVLCTAAIFAIPFLPERVTNRYDDLRNYQEEGSAQSRLWNWEFCKRVGVAHPLTGGGFNFYSLENYARYYPEFLDRWPGKLWTCHSSWFTILGEHGVLAFLIWISLMASCLLSLRRLRAYARSHPDDAWRLQFADTVQIAMITYMIVATFLDAAYFDMFYELVASIIIAKELIRRQELQAAETARAASFERPVLGVKAG